MARIEPGKDTEWHVQSRERNGLARLEQGKRQSGTYREGKETEWHVKSRERDED